MSDKVPGISYFKSIIGGAIATVVGGIILFYFGFGPSTPPDLDRAILSAQFRVGDVVEQYRHFDKTDFRSGPKTGFVGTRWKVLSITDDYIELELVDGRYSPQIGSKTIYHNPGYRAKFNSSYDYRTRFPSRKGNQHIIDEFMKVSP